MFDCDTVVPWMRSSSCTSAEQRQPLTRERVQTTESFLHPLQSVRDTAGLVDDLGALLRLEALDAPTGVVELILEHETLGVTLLLAARVVGELAPQRDELVRQQACLRVADHRGDRRGLAGDLGLTPERLQLPAQLTGEIAQPREVGLHRLELAEGLLLAPAMLEDPRGLLDEAPAVFGRCLQHAVEPALTDDHVHLTAETRVAEKLLHIEEPADVAVDRVLARAVAEQRATDRHLGVLDRQHTVAVVDRRAAPRRDRGARAWRCRRR